ncbi:hypothetical protein B7463_g3224, partial [Scytalidium lignicola]
MEISLSSSRTLPPPPPPSATSSSAWDSSLYSNAFGPEIPSSPFEASPGMMSRMSQMSQMSQVSMDHQVRGLDQNPIQQWYADNDGPWHPIKTIIDPALEALPQDREHVGNLQPSFGTRYRQSNASDSGAFPFRHVTQSDSGYGTATRRSIGNASVYSGEMTEHEPDCQSFIGTVPGDQQLYQGLGEISATRDIKPNAFLYQFPTVTISDAPGLVCPTCHKPVKTKSELKKHNLRHGKPFKCKYPGCTWLQGFSTTNDLERHVNSKHPVKATKRFRCHVPGCKSKDRSWPRLDNFKSHIKRLHPSEWMSNLYREDLIRRAEFIFDPQSGDSLVKEDTISSGVVNPKDTSSQPDFGYDQNASSKGEDRDTCWADTYPGILEDMESPSLEMRLANTVQPLDLFSLQAGNPERKPALESILSGPVGQRDGLSADPSKDSVGDGPNPSRPAKAARQNNGSASDATLTKGASATLACSKEEDAQKNGFPLGSERKYILGLDHSSSIDACRAASDPSGDQQNDEDLGQGDSKSSEEAHPSAAHLSMIKQLEKLGYTVKKDSSLIAAKPQSPEPQNPGSTPGKKSLNLKICPTCKKFKGRPSELKKHMKRHERPWGCTFRDCTREFGSKNDWKRHENSQHFQVETWRCNEERPGGGDCAKVCYRRKSFQDHLKTAHQITDEEEITSRLEKCRIGRNCQARFWCGFCRELVDLKKRGLEAWTERFDHIDDHFMGRKGSEVKSIQDWVNVDGVKPRGESLYAQDENETLERVDPMGEEKESMTPAEGSSAQATIPTDEGLNKRDRSTDSEDNRPIKRKRKGVDVLIYCSAAHVKGAGRNSPFESTRAAQAKNKARSILTSYDIMNLGLPDRMATIGIISIGEMGLGIGQLLKAYGELTKSRAQSVKIELLLSDKELVQRCDYVLSIVPPRDALKTAERILSAAGARTRDTPLYFLDLNAVSPRTARQTATIFQSNPDIKFIDGGIIGGVPYPKPTEPGSGEINWHCPSLIISGPDHIPSQRLIEVLNVHHLNDNIGSATGLKMCFGVTTKGFISLAIQSFTTAHNLGVLSELREYLGKYNPPTLDLAEKGLVTMPPKAYRWVHEMLEIAETMADDGGFSRDTFQGVSDVYKLVADDSELGKEKPGHRVRGKTVEDVVELLSQGIEAKKLKTE